MPNGKMADDFLAKNGQDIDFYRKLVQKYLNLHVYQAAQFWAEKVVALTEGGAGDVYCLAQTMVFLKQYHRAIHLLQSTELDKAYYLGSYLTAHCLFAIKDYKKALDILEGVDMDALSQNESGTADKGLINNTSKHEILASLLLLKGKVLEIMENHAAARRCFVEALTSDVHCFEAYQLIVQHNLLNTAEEEKMIKSLPLEQQCSRKDAKVLLTLYLNMSKSYTTHTAESVVKGNKPSTSSDAVSRTGKTEASTDGELFTSATAGLSASKGEPILGSKPSLRNKKARKKKRKWRVLKKETSQTEDHEDKQPAGKTESEEKKQVAEEKEQSEEVEPSQEELEDVVFLARLAESYDMVVAKAQRYYDRHDYTRCIQLTERVLKEDAYHHSCLIVHIACQMELKLHTKLLALAHNLMEVYPTMPIAWYAIGCYYLLSEKSNFSQKYLEKCILLNKSFGPAWIALGHLHATMKKDHDQAVYTYTSAMRYMRGSHLPMMYLAIEFSQSNAALADSYFTKARLVEPHNPDLLQEIGVHEFKRGEFKHARRYFKLAVKHVELIEGPVFSERWAPLLNNLGHTYRKLGKYVKALDHHHKALIIAPRTPKTYAAIAYVNALVGNVSVAIEWFNRAVTGQKDAFSSVMLHLLVEYGDEGPLCYDTERPRSTSPDGMSSHIPINESSFKEDSFGVDSDIPPNALNSQPDTSADVTPLVDPSSNILMILTERIATLQSAISTDRSLLKRSSSSAEPCSSGHSSRLRIASRNISTVDLDDLTPYDPTDPAL